MCLAVPGRILCRLTGPTRALLTGERTAMNYLQTLSGTATRDTCVTGRKDCASNA